MLRMSVICSFFIILLITIKANLACNGYNLKVNYIRNCDKNSVIVLNEDPGLSLSSDCMVTLRGCSEIKKTINSAKAKYRIKKPPMPILEGSIDVCKLLNDFQNDPQVGKVASMFGVGKNCPIKAMKVCGSPDKQIDISKYKNQLGLGAGAPIEMKVEIETDVGPVCFEYNVQLIKQRKG